MKYHVLHDFITSTPFEEKSSDHFIKDLHKMELLTNFDISLTSFQEELQIKGLTHSLELLSEMTSY